MLHYLKPSARFHLFILKRKAIFHLTLTFLLTIFFSVPTIAQNSTKPSSVLQSEADQAANFYQNGETDKATKHQISYLKSIDFDAEPNLAWSAVSTLYQICFAPGFPGFTLSFSPSCNDSAFTFLQKLPIDSFERAKRSLYFNSLLAVATQDRDWLRKIFADNILDHDEYLPDYPFYIERQLLAAEGHILLKDYARARRSVDKALSTILAIQTDSGGSWQLSRWLLGAISIYQKLNDFKTAIGLFAAAGDLFGLSLSLNSPDGMAYYLLGSDLSLKAGYYHQAIFYSDALLHQLDRPEIDMIGKPIWRVSALGQKASACLLLGDQECVRTIIERSESGSIYRSIDSEIEELSQLTAGMSLALKVIYTRFIGDPIAEGDRLSYLKELEVFKTQAPAPEIRDLMSFAHALLNQKTSIQKKTFVEVSRSALQRFEQAGSLPLGQIPIASLGDRILWLMTLLSLEDSEKELSKDEKALAFNMAEALSRTTISVEGDDLALVAGSEDLEKRRLVHQYLRITSRQRANYLSLTKDFAQVLSKKISQGKDDPDLGLKLDFNLRQDISDYGIQRDRLIPLVWEQGSLIPFLPTLTMAQTSLSGDEAILYNLDLGQTKLAVCVRSNHFGIYKHLLSDEKQFTFDWKLLQISISGIYSPSPLKDTQFPVESALRLYSALIRPAEGCIQPGDTVYMVNRHTNFPFELLLEKKPTKLGAGFSLKDADWAINKYNFSYIGSVREFLALRKIDNRAVKPSKFLGVGEPLLTGLTSSGTDIQKHLERGAIGLNMASIGKLPPLPDTALELESVLKNFKGNGKILLGAEATELSVRRAGLGDFGYLSFATHGLAREEINGINEAALVLTPVESSGRLNDGLLTSSELADLSLNARVAVLSACNTAGTSGGLSVPEMQGLTSALAVAGVPSSVATITAVDSYSIRLVIEKFFSYLVNSDLTVAQALAKAKTNFIKSPPSIEYSHPRFWAPILAFGNSKKSKKNPESELFKWERKKYFGVRDSEILKITSDAEGNTYAVFIDDPVKRQDLDGTLESQTKIAKINSSLSFDWNWGKFGHGNSATLIPTKGSIIFPSQYVAKFSTETLKRTYANSIHAIDKITGKELWSIEPPENGSDLSLVGGALAKKSESVAAYYSYGSKGADKGWLLVSPESEIDFKWQEIYKFQDGSTPFFLGGFVLNLGETLLVGFSEATKLDPERLSHDAFDNLHFCDYEVDANLIWLDSVTFSEVNRVRLSNFIAASAIKKDDGKTVLVGSDGLLCSDSSNPRNLTVFELDGIKATQRFVDNLNHTSFGNEVVQLPTGHLLLVGSAMRYFGSESFGEAESANSDSAETYTSRRNAEDGLLILLDSDYREIGRVWSEIGVDLFFKTAHITKGRILVGGKAGNKAFLGELKIDDSILKTNARTTH